MEKVKPNVCQQDVNIKIYSHHAILKVPSDKNFLLPLLSELDPKSFPNILHSLRVQRFFFFSPHTPFFFFSKFQLAFSQESQIHLAVSSQAFHRLLSPTPSKIESRVLWQGLVKIDVLSLKHSANKSFKLFLYVSFKKGISQRVNGRV